MQSKKYYVEKLSLMTNVLGESFLCLNERIFEKKVMTSASVKKLALYKH